MEELFLSLSKMDHSLQCRRKMAMVVTNDPTLIRPLLELAFIVDQSISIKAAWVLEQLARERLDHLYPYMDLFVENLDKVHQDSAVRPMAKICEYLTTAHFLKGDPEIKKVLNELHWSQITTVCFDWLIGDHKVAAKAYAMECLWLLGKKFGWVHPELQMVLSQNYADGSAAYKARARMVLSKIKGIKSAT